MTETLDVNKLSAEQIAGMDFDQLLQLTGESDETQPIENDGVNNSEESPAPTTIDEVIAETVDLDESKAKGVFSKNGEHVLPFEVVTKARDEAKTEREARVAAQAKIAELEAQLKTSSEVSAEVNQEDFYDDDDLELLAEDQPELASKIKALQSLAVSQATQLKSQEAVQLKTAQEKIDIEFRNAIDSIPLLATLEADANSDGWNKAAIIDKTLRNDPQFSKLSVQDRLTMVAERYQAVYGLPALLSGSKTQQDKVKEALSKANSPIKPPVSQSDLGGGSPPSNDHLGDLLKKPYHEIEAEIMKMPPDKQVAILAKLSAMNT